MSPAIYKTGNLQIRVYPKDHNPPHVHVVGPEAEAKFKLDNLECFYSKGFSRRSLKRIEDYLRERKQTLMEAWNDYQE